MRFTRKFRPKFSSTSDGVSGTTVETVVVSEEVLDQRIVLPESYGLLHQLTLTEKFDGAFVAEKALGDNPAHVHFLGQAFSFEIGLVHPNAVDFVAVDLHDGVADFQSAVKSGALGNAVDQLARMSVFAFAGDLMEDTVVLGVGVLEG